MGRQHTWLWWTLTGAIAAWLLWMTLRPNQTVAADLALLTAQAIPAHLLIDLAGNVAVFIPLGAALSLALGGKLATRRLLLAVGLGSFFSLLIELGQLLVPSRMTALDDWLLNTAGTAIGALVGLILARSQVSFSPDNSSRRTE